jgi:hypothetical protein
VTAGLVPSREQYAKVGSWLRDAGQNGDGSAPVLIAYRARKPRPNGLGLRDLELFAAIILS